MRRRYHGAAGADGDRSADGSDVRCVNMMPSLSEASIGTPEAVSRRSGAYAPVMDRRAAGTASLWIVTTIRALLPADRDAWLPLWRGYLEFYETELSDEQTTLTWNRLVDPQFPIHGALAIGDDGTAVGLVHWLTHAATWAAEPYCYLEDLFVDPAVRGAGAGRALIAHVAAWAEDHGSPKVYWLTQETNATARTLYDRVATHTGYVHYQIGLGA